MKNSLKIAALIVLSMFAACSGSQQNNKTTTEVTAQEKPEIEILSQNVTNTDVGITIVAEVRNNTKKTATYVGLKSVFTDSTNVIIGTGMGNTMELAPGQTKTIEVLSTDDASKVDKYKVELDDVYWAE